MGTWLNVAFIQSADTQRVEKELASLLTERGRQLTTPKQRTPKSSDPMQYGIGDEVQRWGVAGFQGTPGWTVLRTAPFELLMQGKPPLLARLAARMRVPAFQYNIYDSTSNFLMEVDEEGHVELSGFVGQDVTRYWGGEPPEDRLHVRFHTIDPSAVALWAEAVMPEARVEGRLPTARRVQQRADLQHWLDETGADIDSERDTWRTHPAQVVRRLSLVGSAHLSLEGCIDEAIMTVFGGTNLKHCDNDFLVQTLIPHAPIPVAGFVLYAETSVEQTGA
jgi:hypothetical protein